MGTRLFDPIFNYIKQTWRLFRRDYPRPHPRSAQGFRMMCNGGVLKVPGYIKTLWELDMEQDQCLPSQCWLIEVTYWCCILSGCSSSLLSFFALWHQIKVTFTKSWQRKATSYQAESAKWKDSRLNQEGQAYKGLGFVWRIVPQFSLVIFAKQLEPCSTCSFRSCCLRQSFQTEKSRSHVKSGHLGNLFTARPFAVPERRRRWQHGQSRPSYINLPPWVLLYYPLLYFELKQVVHPVNFKNVVCGVMLCYTL